MKKKKEVPFSFGLKLEFKEKKKIYDIIRLEHKTDGHNKFYTIEFIRKGNSPDSNFTVKCGYGKIGNSPQYSNRGFSTEISARNFMTKKLKQELKKGYIQTNL